MLRTGDRVFIASGDYNIGGIYPAVKVGTTKDEDGFEYHWLRLERALGLEAPAGTVSDEWIVCLLARGNSSRLFGLCIPKTPTLPESEGEFRSRYELHCFAWVEIFATAEDAKEGAL